MKLVVLVALVACSTEERTRTRAEPERPFPRPTVAKPASVDALLADVRKKVAHPSVPSRIVIENVRADGSLEPSRGELEVWFVAPDGCQILKWRNEVWSALPCSPSTSSANQPIVVRCTAAMIWDRAIAKGAPRDAVATVSISSGTQTPRWAFRIGDASFTFDDDCDPVVEAR